MDQLKEKMELDKKTILLVGASGLFGSNFVNKNINKYNIVCNLNKKKVYSLINNKSKFDLFNKKILIKQIKKIKPDIILNAAGLTDINGCEINRNKATKVNFHLVKNLVSVANLLDIKFLQISTDHIFDGLKKKYYKETDKATPLNHYAKTKLDADNYILKNCKKYLILRTNFFGWGTSHRNSLSDYIIKNLSLNKKIYLNDDIYFNPVYLGNLIECINNLIQKNKYGIYNIASNKSISKFLFGVKLARFFELNYKLIQKNTKKDVIKPKNMSLDNSKIKKIVNPKFLNLSKNLLNLKQDFVKPYVRNFYEFYPYGKHFLFKEDLNSVLSVLKSKNLTQGPKIDEFEEKVCKEVGSQYAVAVSSCSAGLHLACKVAGLNFNNTLVTSPNTFVSSANAALHCNSNVDFVDIDPLTGNLSLELLEKKINSKKRIRAIMPVHFGGLPCDVKKINKLAKKKKKIFIIEDAAHALGAKYLDGSTVGSCKYSDMTVFSFHPVKSIASGEGGVITTNDKEIYRKLKSLRSHGITRSEKAFLNNSNAFSKNQKNIWYYEMQDLGFHYRLTDIQSALGASQLDNLSIFIKKRKQLAERYDKYFRNLSKAKILQYSMRSNSANHLYILLIDFKKLGISKTKFMERLMYLGIGTQVHYIPVPYHPYFKKKFNYKLKNLKSSIDYYNKALSIPLYYNLNFSTQKKIIKIISSFLI